MSKKPFHISERLRSFVYAWRGIKSFVRREHNAWIHCAIIVVVTIAGFFFGITGWEWIAIVFSFGLVLAAEAFNSSIERLTDMVSPEKCKAAANVKDIAAGAVLICCIAAAIIGIIIFLPYITDLFYEAN